MWPPIIGFKIGDAGLSNTAESRLLHATQILTLTFRGRFSGAIWNISTNTSLRTQIGTMSSSVSERRSLQIGHNGGRGDVGYFLETKGRFFATPIPFTSGQSRESMRTYDLPADG